MTDGSRNMARRILIVGSNGLLGQRAVAEFARTDRVSGAAIEPRSVFGDRLEYHWLDITDAQAVARVLDAVAPDVVFNAAAYTQVDRAEDERELCRAVNVTGVRNLARACAERDIFLVHISTDYVFDGARGDYTEEDEPNPVNFYGRSKLEGEWAVLESGCRYLIARTAVLYGTGKNIAENFATWVIRALHSGETIRVVDDQIGNPTLADDLAAAVHRLLDQQAAGLYHVAGSEPISRYDFARAVAQIFGLDRGEIVRIKTKDFPQRAKRPLNVSLNVSRVHREFGVQLGDVASSLRRLKERLQQGEANRLI